MVPYYGDFAEDDTVLIPFNTFSSDDPAASVTITNLADADLKVHKDGAIAQIVTDGATIAIDFDGITGNHLATIDTSVDAAYATGSEYAVRMEGTTVDGATINAWIGAFSIERAGAALALLKGTNSLANIEDKIDIIDTNVDQIETAVITNAAGTDVAADIIAVKAETVLILADTDDIGVAGAGLTDLGGMSTGMKNEMNAEADTAIADVNLDHLVGTATAIPAIPAGTYIDLMQDDGTAVYNRSTDSLQAIRDNQAAAAPTVGAIADAVADEVLTGATHNVTNSLGRRIRQIQEAGSYSLGHVYIDTVGGTDGTTNFENGVDILPVKTIGDANTIATSVGLDRFSVSPASSITFAASQADDEFHGENWTLALGGQAIGGIHVNGADVTGTGTCASEAHFQHCELGTMTIGIAHFDNCDIEGTVTLAGAGTYRFFDCRHSGTAVIDFGTEASVNMTVHVHAYNGALTIENLGNSGTDVLHFDSSGGQLTLAASCVAGTVNFRGTAALVNNGSGMTINRGGDVVNDVAGVQSDTDDIQTRLPAALVGGRMDSNAGAISGDATAADNLELFVEGTALGTLPKVDTQQINAADVIGDGNATPWDGA